MSDILDQDIPDLLPAFYAARLNGDSYYDDIYILIVDPGDTEADILQKLATKLGKGGKRGVAVLILPIDNAEDIEPDNRSSGPLKLTVTFQVWENRQINKSSAGTGKNGFGVAVHTRELFKHFSVRGVAKLLVPGKPAIQRVAPPVGTEKKLRGWGINFTAFTDTNFVIEKVALPVFTPARGVTATAAIACGTAGAAIYYTTDGSAPDKTKTLYAAPVDITEATTIFAAAFLDGDFPSDTISATFTNP